MSPLTPTLSENKPRSETEMQSVDTERKEAVANSIPLTGDDSSEEGGEQRGGMNRTKWLACLALALAYSTTMQQHTSIASIVKHIDNDLGPTTYYNWMLSGNTIANAMILPLCGGLSDIFGRKWFLVAGCAICLVGAAIGLAAQNIPTMIAAMILKGIGSGPQLLATAAISEIVPNKHRGTTQGLLDFGTMPWTVFGAMIGNSMVMHYALSYRINWIIGIILNALSIVMVCLYYHPPAGTLPPGVSKLKAFRELDWIGISLYGIGIVLVLMGIGFGGQTFPWRSAGVIAPICIGLFSFVALGFWEWKGTRNPFFAHEMFRGRSSRFPVLLACCFVGGMSLFAANAFWTQQAQAMFFSDPDKIGISALPVGIGATIGGLIGGLVLGKHRLFTIRNLLLFGCTLTLAFDVMFTRVTPSTLPLALCAGFFSMVGMGVLMVGIIVTTQLICQDSHIGLATLLLSSIRSLGGSVSIIAYTSIMQNTIKKEVGPRVAKAVAGMGVPPETLPKLIGLMMAEKVKEAGTLPDVSEAAVKAADQAVKWAWSVAFQNIYYACIAFTAVALLLSFFVPDVSDAMTDHVAVTLANDKKAKKGGRSEKQV